MQKWQPDQCLEKKKKIGFITTDTYRIAAIEQLKTYANLLQAPVEIVYNSDDYKKAIEKFEHLDLVFIDTAGRNYKEAKYVNDLKKMINFDEEVESYLSSISDMLKKKIWKQLLNNLMKFQSRSLSLQKLMKQILLALCII